MSGLPNMNMLVNVIKSCGASCKNQSHVQKYPEISHGMKQKSGYGWVGVVECEPLEDDHENEVAKEAAQEQHLGDELGYYIQGSLEVPESEHTTRLTGHLARFSGSYVWLKRESHTPNIMCITPRMTDNFILNEFKKSSLFSATCQIYNRSLLISEIT